MLCRALSQSLAPLASCRDTLGQRYFVTFRQRLFMFGHIEHMIMLKMTRLVSGRMETPASWVTVVCVTLHKPCSPPLFGTFAFRKNATTRHLFNPFEKLCRWLYAAGTLKPRASILKGELRYFAH